MKIKLLGNAGLVFEIEDKKIMVDGLYKNTMDTFSDLAPRILRPMLNGVGEYSNVDYILFTHDHPGHFNAGYLKRYMKKNNIIAAFMPDSRGIIKDFNRMGYNKIQNLMPDLYTRMRLALDEEFTIDFFKLPHFGRHYENEVNISYIIEHDGYKVLIVGHGSWNLDYYRNVIGREEIHVIVVNPFFYNSSQAIELIEYFKIPNVIVYNIPLEVDDKNGLRDLVKADMEKNESRSFRTITLMESEASVLIG